ncbi:MAG: hypothetical protein JSR09_10835 [Bacteroidetes bacterium]|nr:hypothetical protein [Bacteroidota bacterium]MBS1650186.1 hypothetical protein [Bacteroidota bacterium]
MRLICTLFVFLTISTTSYAQNITGIWRGYFVQKAFNEITGKFVEDKYKYEIQINQLPNNAIEGVTYSYKNIVFYGKASFKGIFTKNTENVLVKELKMLELKISNNSEPCLMTCYLDLKQEGKTQILSGTYTSLNDKTKTDCGEGMIYLEKVPESDFKKEDFLTKKKEETTNATATHKNIDSKKGNIKKIQLALGLTPDGVAGPKTTAALKAKIPTLQQPVDYANDVEVKHILNKLMPTNKPSVTPETKHITTIKKPTVKPGAEEFIIRKKAAIPTPPKNNNHVDTVAVVTAPSIKNEKPAAPKPTPPILLERENKLTKTIEVDVKNVEISFYDNGKIDNDSITVYMNNEKVINHQRLSYKPITLHLHLDEISSLKELITVADNLGDEPPNTALMVITAGNKRYEVTVTSDEKTNSKVIIKYNPNAVKVEQ